MTPIQLAVDAMGGDFAPQEIVAGAVQGAREHHVALLLVGEPQIVQAELARHDTSGLDITLIPCDDVIRMDEDPALAVRSRAGASINVACRLVLDGQADGVVTMGHTGAGFVAALMHFGRIPGVQRPAILVPFLGLRKDLYLVDAGANTDVRPEHLLAFARMGSVYVARVAGIPQPAVGLLSNGAEPNKGNRIYKAAWPLLQAAPDIHFIGNVEGHDLFQRSPVNVVVTDGFLGNVVFKTLEGTITQVLAQVAEVLDTLPPEAAAVVRAHLDLVQARNHYARYGAAVLLGVRHPMFIGHGRSRAVAVRHALGTAKRMITAGVIPTLVTAFQGETPP